jgi:quinol monooxygenase YgiN
VSGRFVVKTVSRIQPGKAEAYRPVISEFCKLVEETEPRLLAFHIYVSEDQSSEVVIQIHPDAESMQYHLDVMGRKVRETFAYADFESLEIYGQPNDEPREWIERVSEGVPFTLHEMHWGGFTRLAETEANAAG